MQKLLISLINIYQKYLSFDSGILAILVPGGACRYKISCSEYTKLSIKKFGIQKGIGLGLKRLASCNPWN